MADLRPEREHQAALAPGTLSSGKTLRTMNRSAPFILAAVFAPGRAMSGQRFASSPQSRRMHAFSPFPHPLTQRRGSSGPSVGSRFSGEPPGRPDQSMSNFTQTVIKKRSIHGFKSARVQGFEPRALALLHPSTHHGRSPVKPDLHHRLSKNLATNDNKRIDGWGALKHNG